MDSYSNTLTEYVGKRSNTDQAFVQYIKDHYLVIRDTARTISIDVTDQFTYRYRLRDFLIYKNYSPDLEWIVLWLNQIPSSEYFVGVATLMLPSESQISSLATAYRTTKTPATTSAKDALERWY